MRRLLLSALVCAPCGALLALVPPREEPSPVRHERPSPRVVRPGARVVLPALPAAPIVLPVGAPVARGSVPAPEGPSPDDLARVAMTGADPALRQGAINALGELEADRARVLKLLEHGLSRETDPVLRRSWLVAIVTAGRQDARGVLEAVAIREPDLATEAGDWLAALATGERDPERIWEAKRGLAVARHGPSRGLTLEEE